jgi:predicted metal-binding membrane protein
MSGMAWEACCAGDQQACSAGDQQACSAGDQEATRLLVPGRASQGFFFGVSALVFVASAAVTVQWCTSMATGCGCGMDQAGACPLATSMWRPGPEQGWLGVAAEFLGMWMVMMVAMMLPSLVPVLWRYRQAVGGVDAARVGVAVSGSAEGGGTRLGWLTVLVGVGYFAVWTLAGVIAFPVGVALSVAVREIPVLANAMPIAVGVIVVLAGALQFTAWKSRQLACCRGTSAGAQTLAADARTAWRHGLRLGLHCVRCCAGMTVMLLAVGMMDLAAMALVTLAITLERLAPAGEHVARGIGIITIVVGSCFIVRAVGLA